MTHSESHRPRFGTVCSMTVLFLFFSPQPVFRHAHICGIVSLGIRDHLLDGRPVEGTGNRGLIYGDGSAQGAVVVDPLGVLCGETDAAVGFCGSQPVVGAGL